MLFSQGKRNQLRRVFQPADFVALGLSAHYSENDTITISRGGKRLGKISKLVGKFVWQSADADESEYCAFTREKLLTELARRC